MSPENVSYENTFAIRHSLTRLYDTQRWRLRPFCVRVPPKKETFICTVSHIIFCRYWFQTSGPSNGESSTLRAKRFNKRFASPENFMDGSPHLSIIPTNQRWTERTVYQRNKIAQLSNPRRRLKDVLSFADSSRVHCQSQFQRQMLKESTKGNYYPHTQT